LYFISFILFNLFIYRKWREKTNNPIPLTRGGQRDDPKQMMNVPMKVGKISKYLCVHYLLIPSIHECFDYKLSVFCLDYYPHLVPRRPHLSGTEEPTQPFASNHLNDSKLHVVKSSHGLLPHQTWNRRIAMAFFLQDHNFHIWQSTTFSLSITSV